MTTYLHQKSGTCCILYALLNALRYFGLSTPKPGSKTFKSLVDKAGCRHGSATRIDEVATHLGLCRESIDVEDVLLHLPAMLNVYINPFRSSISNEMIGKRHVVLVIGGDTEMLRLVNYRTNGPVVEDVRRDALTLPKPGHWFRAAWAIKRVQDHGEVAELVEGTRLLSGHR